MVGLLINDKKGTIATVKRTPISGEEAINTKITAINMAIKIFTGWIKNANIPATNPKKSIKFPFPRLGFIFLASVSSEIPKHP